MDFKKLGLKAGLEIHQQLDTKYKLFCKSSAAMKDKEIIGMIKRKQHPVAGELGVIDIAMMHEMMRDRTFHYQLFPHETCLVEVDEEPPHELNLEALEVALKIALMLNCTIPDELQVMRKSISDGSNTSAFQRTIVVGLNGFLKYMGKKVEITFINLEEDAAPTVSEENGNVTFRLSRLGVPLIEIGTGLLEGFAPDEIQDIAFNIGMLLRSTGKVKRGIGTIRQDVNVSIKVGERTELKGMQDLWSMSKAIQNEISRQLTMSEIRNEMKRKGKVNETFVEVNSLIQNTKSKILKNMIDSGANVFAIKLPGFAGVLKREIYPGKTLGKDLAEYVAAFGVKGILHSDEDLAKYAAVEDFQRIREHVKAGEKDAVILIGEHKDKGKVAKLLIEKINTFLERPEKETRAVGDDGHIRFNRPLPGAQRLYPETDVIPFSVSKEWLKRLKKELPEPWTKKLEKFKEMKLSDDLAKQILRSEYLESFEKFVKMKGVEPSLVANVFTGTLKELRRENVEISNLADNNFEEVFEAISSKKIMKEALPEVLKYLAENPTHSVTNAIGKLNLKTLSKGELEKIVKEVASQPNIQFDKAVGLVMSQVRGRADPQEVIRLVKKFK
ncbi:MAG: Glu-tRNA(Gln) amidotransferase subunit GatE [Candidatus Aenigmatarchaeota archaeon]